jgi:hypothetical protein
VRMSDLHQDRLGSSRSLIRLNTLLVPGTQHNFDPFLKPFVFSDAVLDLWSFPDALNSTAFCLIGLAVPNEFSEVLFSCWIDEYGRQIHLNSGIVCPRNSNLWVSAGVSATGGNADLRVLLTGSLTD